MRLADFILSNREAILSEWEAFARTCAPASGTMDVAALRDHADQMLSVIAEDLQTPQGGAEQSEKSMGRAPAEHATAATAAAEHGAGRADSGFTVDQMVAEYRALRASVIRLWTAAKGELVPADVEDLTRFNEAIDQSLAESVARYNQDLEQSKELFLAILGHDLRTPLGAISTSARFILDRDALEGPDRTLAARIATSASRALQMVGDLLDFTRGRLAGGIPVRPTEADLESILRDVVDEIHAARPETAVEIETQGDTRGEWDAGRIAQAFSNLVTNALQHGADDTAVKVAVRSDDEELAVVVHNQGAAITPEQLDGIFNPLKSRARSSGGSAGPTGSLGLGLYITQQIISAHDGRVVVDSSDAAGTTFTVYLPRRGGAGI